MAKAQRQKEERGTYFVKRIALHAFSLIELIVVIMMIGILAIVATVNFTGVDSQSNRIAANELRASLNYIRHTAVSHERAMKVLFDVVSNRYEVYMATNDWTDGYLPAKDPVTREDWSVDLNNKFSGVALATININGANTLYFSATNGAPFDINRAPATNGVITFSSGITVTITPDTGYVDLE